MVKKRPSINLSRPIPAQTGDMETLFAGKDDVEQAAGLQLLALRCDAIFPDPNQPRSTFHDDSLQELAESIKQDGVIQPIEVTQVRAGQYMIVHGERRWRAAQLAGLESIPAVVRRRSYDEVTRFVRQLVENIQREDLNDVDRAYGMVRLRDLLQEELDAQIRDGQTSSKPHSRSITWAKVSERLGFSRQRASQIIQLLDLPDEIKTAVREGTISEQDTRILKGLKPSQQRALYRALEAGDVDKAEYKQVARYLKHDAPDASVHEAIRVLHMPLPPVTAVIEPIFDSSLGPVEPLDSPEPPEDQIPNLLPNQLTTKPTHLQRLHWIRTHLSRISAQSTTPAERQEMRRLLQLIQQDVASLLAALEK
ncbi:MAG: ParB/RepB/Spo0J family partition protein [Chloroflexi bacterium]|nr:ParB/RepB/Spo0J family partition protein [Chloroflexota bacterium]